MRLWSIHPKYLDQKGLVAVWREALLAKAVLEGRTKGYTKHPQLERFQASQDPVGSLHTYLLTIWEEADARGYSFSRQKIGRRSGESLTVSDRQLAFELAHLKKKLALRDKERSRELKKVINAEPHPLFVVQKGDVASWERV
jgi:hypothetical protein